MRKKKKTQQWFMQVEFHDRLLKFVIDVNLFFRSIESLALKKMLQYLRSRLKLSDRISFDNMMRTRALKTKKHILKDLKFKIKIFIALNVWTSMNHIAFLRITCYFMNRHFDYKEMLLLFKSLQEKHTEEKLTETILNVLLKYDLIKWLLAVIADNAFNNLFTRIHLKRKLRALSINWDVVNDTINCMTHVLQLTIIAFLFKLKILVANDEISVRFDEKNFENVKKNVFFENTLRKIS